MVIDCMQQCLPKAGTWSVSPSKNHWGLTRRPKGVLPAGQSVNSPWLENLNGYSAISWKIRYGKLRQ